MLTASFEDLRRAERILLVFRWVGSVFALLQVVVYHRLPWPPLIQEIGLALAAVLVVGNVVAWTWYRRVRTLRQAQWMAITSFAFDLIMASAFVWLFTFDELSAVWAVLYVLPLEGALRFRLRGAMAAWLVTTILFAAREIWGADRYGYQLLWHSVSFRMGIGFLIALVAGLMSEDLTRQRARLSDAVQQLRRQDHFRSDLIRSLSSDARGSVAVILAEAAAKGVQGVRSRVRLFLPGGRQHCYVWPPDASEEGDFDHEVTVVHHGEVLGDIGVCKAAGDPITQSDQELLSGLASQAALALRNLRLAGELEERLDELKASRERIVTAQDSERRRLERDIHDGAQQQLVAMAIKLGLAKALVAEDPDEAGQVLDQLKEEARDTLETLRDLARGVFPPLLVDSGLVPALKAHVSKVAMKVEIEADSVAVTRFDPQVEAAVYFFCREALQNAAKHAPGSDVTVRMAVEDGWLVFSVSDNGEGFDPEAVHEGSGLRNLADRVEALGGRLELRTAPGQGTTVGGRVPARIVSAGDGDGRAPATSSATSPA